MAKCVYTAKGISTKAKSSFQKRTTMDHGSPGEQDVIWYDEKTFLSMIESLPCETVFFALKKAMDQYQKALEDHDVDPSLISAAIQAKSAIDTVFAAAADEIWPISIDDTIFGIVWDDRKAREDCEMIVDTKTISLSTIRPNSLQIEAAGFKAKKNGKRSVYKAIFRDIYTIDSPSENERFSGETVSYANRIDNDIAKKHFTAITRVVKENQPAIDVYSEARESALLPAENSFYEAVVAVTSVSWPFPVGNAMDYRKDGIGHRIVIERVYPQVFMQKGILSFAIKGHNVTDVSDKMTTYAKIRVDPV